MARATNWACLRPGKGPRLVVSMGILAATAMGAEGAVMDPGIKKAHKLLPAETTVGADGDQENISYATSISSTSMGEVFEACSAEAECSACLEIHPDIDCMRDTIVNAAHCSDVSEVLCCAFYNDPDCMDNATLLQAIEDLNENVCSLELPCLGGGIEMLNLGGDNAGLLVVSGPDALINNPGIEQDATIVPGTEGPNVDAEAIKPDESVEELKNGASVVMGVIAPTAVAAVCAAAAFAGQAFLAGSM